MPSETRYWLLALILLLDMKRWQCNVCPVPPIDAKPLVENSFKGQWLSDL
jgi:hypothetical protein